jgi:hypothetical protein
VILIVNNEEHLLRALSNTGASSSIILEAYTSAIFPFIKIDDSNTTTWSIMGGKFTTTKTGFVTFSLPEFNLKKKSVLLGHFMLMTVLSHQTHMIWLLAIN